MAIMQSVYFFKYAIDVVKGSMFTGSHCGTISVE